MQCLHQMFNVFALLLDDTLELATPLTNGANFWATLFTVHVAGRNCVNTQKDALQNLTVTYNCMKINVKKRVCINRKLNCREF